MLRDEMSHRETRKMERAYICADTSGDPPFRASITRVFVSTPIEALRRSHPLTFDSIAGPYMVEAVLSRIAPSINQIGRAHV